MIPDFSVMKDLAADDHNRLDPGYLASRISIGFRQDAICSMIPSLAVQPLIEAVLNETHPYRTAPDQWVNGTEPGGLYSLVLIKVIPKTILERFLSSEARTHIAEVIRDSVFPESARSRSRKAG